MLPVPEDRQTQALQSEIFLEIGMADGVLQILREDLLPGTGIIARRGSHDESDLAPDRGQQASAIGLSLDGLDGMPHQLHPRVAKGKLPLAVGHLPHKGRVFFDVPGDIHGPTDAAVVVPAADIGFERPFPHGGSEDMGEEKRQNLKQLRFLAGIGCQVHGVGKIQDLGQKIRKK